jgi:murein DD-endopeptidase MepM/ murein hydrolase activator NlpD
MAQETADGVPISDGFDYPVGPRDATDVFKTHRIAAGLVDDDYFKSTGYWHPGEDWNGNGGGDTDLGDPIYAISNGKVLEFGHYSVWGNLVLIEHALPNGTRVWSQYAHLDKILASQVGQKVKRGDQIGTMGKGDKNRYLAHLHFEVRKKKLPIGNWSPMVKDKSAVLANYYSPADFIKEHRPGSLAAPQPQPSSPQPVTTTPALIPQIYIDTRNSTPQTGKFFGSKDSQWNLSTGGFKANMLWVPASPQQRTHWGEWRPSIPTEGKWEVWVHVPAKNASTTYAQYQVVHLDGQTTIPVNQGSNPGKWEILGTFRFAPGKGYVRLTNVTGELSHGARHQVAFDAVCWTKVD